MADIDFAKIKRNISKMLDQGAPEADIDAYLKSEGVTPEQLQSAPKESETLSQVADAAKQFGYGGVEGLASIAGIQGDVRELIDRGIDWGAEKLGLPAKGPRPRGALSPTTSEVLEAIKPVTGDMPKSESDVSQYARTTGQFATGALAPGGPIRRVANVVIPAVVSETAGRMAPEGYETPARVAGGVLGGVAASARVPTMGANARAEKTLSEIVTPESATRLQELGPEAFLFEGNPTLTQVAQGVVQRPGPSSESLRTAVTERHESAPARLDQDIRDNFGPPVAPSRVDERIGQAQRELAPDYRAALHSANPVDVQPILTALDTDISRAAGAPRQALQQIRGYFFDGNRLKTSAGELLAVRQGLDDLLPRFEGQNNATRLVSEYRGFIDDAIRRAAPDVKLVDTRFERLARQREALEQGGTVLRTGPEAMRPSELERILAGLDSGQRAALRMGTRADIERVLGTSVFDVNAIRGLIKTDGKWAHQKLASIFGQEEADNLIRAVDREVEFKKTFSKLIENSATAPRLVAEEATRVKGPANVTPEMIAGVVAGGMTGSPGVGLGTAAAAGGAKKIWETLAAGGQRRLDAALVDRLSAQGPERDELVQALLNRRGPKNSTRDMLVRALLGGAGGSVPARGQ